MDEKDYIARAATTIEADIETVWKALITPSIIKEYMFGTTVTSDFKEGSDIRWTGEWEGRQYEDKGKILEVRPNKTLKYSHFSPMSGEPDIPDNYHSVKISLSEQNGKTEVLLEQDNNKTADAKLHAEKNWKGMLEGLKSYVEKQKRST